MESAPVFPSLSICERNHFLERRNSGRADERSPRISFLSKTIPHPAHSPSRPRAPKQRGLIDPSTASRRNATPRSSSWATSREWSSSPSPKTRTPPEKGQRYLMCRRSVKVVEGKCNQRSLRVLNSRPTRPPDVSAWPLPRLTLADRLQLLPCHASMGGPMNLGRYLVVASRKTSPCP